MPTEKNTRLENFEQSLDSAKRLAQIVACWFSLPDSEESWPAYREKPKLTVLQGGASNTVEGSAS